MPPPIPRFPSTGDEFFFPPSGRKAIPGRFGRWRWMGRGCVRSRTAPAIASNRNTCHGTRLCIPSPSGSGGQRNAAVYVGRMDGTNAHPITFGPGNFQVETVLRSGRILVSAESPLVSATTKKTRTLFTLRPDGSGLALLRDDSNWGKNRGGAVELADGTIVFLETAGGSAGGQLASIRQGALRASSVAGPSANYASVEQLGDATLVVAKEDSADSKNRKL